MQSPTFNYPFFPRFDQYSVRLRRHETDIFQNSPLLLLPFCPSSSSRSRKPPPGDFRRRSGDPGPFLGDSQEFPDVVVVVGSSFSTLAVHFHDRSTEIASAIKYNWENVATADSDDECVFNNFINKNVVYFLQLVSLIIRKLFPRILVQIWPINGTKQQPTPIN